MGRWELEKIFQQGNDVTKQHDPKDNRYIHFTDEGRFESGGDPVGQNSGSWSLLPDTEELFIDSDAGEDDDSYWKVTISQERMSWQGTRGFGTAFELRFTR